MPSDRADQIKALLKSGAGVRETARQTGAGTATVQRIKRSLMVSANAGSVGDDLAA
jgi:uncharacterized protein YerC